jgi:hypothetical protein
MNENELNIKQIESMPEYIADAAAVKLSAERRKEIGAKCKARLDQLKQDRKNANWEAEKQKDFDAYHLVAPKKALPYKGYPNLACPFPRIGTDTFHANVMFTFGGQTGKFHVLPDYMSKSHMDSAKRAADYMSYVLNYEADLYNTLDKADYDAQKYGNGYIKAQYVKEYAYETITTTEEESVPDINEVTGEVTPKVVKRRKTKREKRCIFDGTRTMRVSPECIFVSPFFEEIEDAINKDYFFEVEPYTVRYLTELSKAQNKGEEPFLNPDAVKEVKDVQRALLVSNLERNKQQYDGYMVDAQVELLPIELAEAHFKEDVNDDGFAEKVAVVFETSTGTVLRVSYAECRVVPVTPRPVDGRWDGESIRKVAEPVCLEWEAIHNSRVAKGQWANTPFGFYTAGGRFNPQTLTIMPGKMYPVNDAHGVNFPAPPPPDPSYFNEEQLLQGYLDRLLAMGDSIQGVQGGGEASATSTIQSQQRAGIRLSNPINRIARSLGKLMDHIWDLNRQCAPRIKEYRIVGIGDGVPVFSKITSQDYANKVSFKIQMATMFDVQMVRDTALLNYKTFISNPMFMNNPASFYSLTKETMDAVGLHIDLPKPPQAKVISPFAEIDLIREGETVEPVVGEDPDEHLKAYKEFMKTEDYENWPDNAKLRLQELYDKTQMLKQTLEASNLNQSGMFEGMPGGGAALPPQAGMTSTRNPTQAFNTTRMTDSPKSKSDNLRKTANPNNGSY